MTTIDPSSSPPTKTMACSFSFAHGRRRRDRITKCPEVMSTRKILTPLHFQVSSVDAVMVSTTIILSHGLLLALSSTFHFNSSNCNTIIIVTKNIFLSTVYYSKTPMEATTAPHTSSKDVKLEQPENFSRKPDWTSETLSIG